MAPTKNNNGTGKVIGIAAAIIIGLVGVIWGFAMRDIAANELNIDANATDIDTLHGNVIGLSRDVSNLINMVQELKESAKEHNKLLMEMSRKLGP